MQILKVATFDQLAFVVTQTYKKKKINDLKNKLCLFYPISSYINTLNNVKCSKVYKISFNNF